MFGIGKLLAACAALTASLNAISDTIAEVNQGLRQRVGLDNQEPDQPALTDHQGAQQPAAEPARNGKGRKTVAAEAHP
jgi:hypothetical protein